MKPAVAAVAKLHGQLEAEIAGGRRRNVLRRIGRRLVEIGGPGLRDAIGALVADGDRGVAVLLLVLWRSQGMLRPRRDVITMQNPQETPMPTDEDVCAFLARGERVLEQARRVTELIRAGMPIPEGTSEAVRILAGLELQQPKRRAAA